MKIEDLKVLLEEVKISKPISNITMDNVSNDSILLTLEYLGSLLRILTYVATSEDMTRSIVYSSLREMEEESDHSSNRS